jgi:hypothetical protein
MVELHVLEIRVNRVGHLTDDKGFGVFDLGLGGEVAHLRGVPAIGAVARHGPFEAGAGRDFEISFAVLFRGLAAQKTVFVQFDRNAQLLRETF